MCVCVCVCVSVFACLHAYSHGQYVVNMMEYHQTEWNGAQCAIANVKLRLQPHPQSFSYKNTQTSHTHAHVKDPNPLCESVSLVVTNTIGLFVCVQERNVYVSKTETNCGCVISVVYICVCCMHVQLYVCLWMHVHV